MENLDNIVPTMVSQHRTLQKDLGESLILVNSGSLDFGRINNGLKQFAIDLPEHLHLENEIFYPELLSVMEKKGLDVSKTEEFINQMQEIGVVLNAFLEKYNDVSSIANQLDVFKQELSGVISALNLRVESEEAGVYGYWELYK